MCVPDVFCPVVGAAVPWTLGADDGVGSTSRCGLGGCARRGRDARGLCCCQWRVMAWSDPHPPRERPLDPRRGRRTRASHGVVGSGERAGEAGRDDGGVGDGPLPSVVASPPALKACFCGGPRHLSLPHAPPSAHARRRRGRKWAAAASLRAISSRVLEARARANGVSVSTVVLRWHMRWNSTATVRTVEL